MEQKRYFIDDMNSTTVTAKDRKHAHLFALFLLVVGFISFFVSQKIGLSKHSYELNAYSADTYNNMLEIAEKVTVEGSGIDLTSIPDDISTYNISYDNDIIEFEYTLKTNENNFYIPIPSMKITLSKDFKILNSDSTFYSSEKSYIKSVKGSIFFTSLFNAFIIIVCCLIFNLVCMYIGMIISYFHKKHDQKILSKKDIKETED